METNTAVNKEKCNLIFIAVSFLFPWGLLWEEDKIWKLNQQLTLVFTKYVKKFNPSEYKTDLAQQHSTSVEQNNLACPITLFMTNTKMTRIANLKL